MSGDVVFVDSSAIVKLVVAEPESAVLRRHLNHHERLATSSLARVEVTRAVHDHGSAVRQRARAVLASFIDVHIGEQVIDVAATLEGASLRTPDAIHVATALLLGRDLGHLVTYDVRMRTAAEAVGIAVRAPGTPAGRSQPGGTR